MLAGVLMVQGVQLGRTMANAAELTVELQETNRRLTIAIDSLRDEIGASEDGGRQD